MAVDTEALSRAWIAWPTRFGRGSCVKGLDRCAAAKPPLTPWSTFKQESPRDPGRTVDPVHRTIHNLLATLLCSGFEVSRAHLAHFGINGPRATHPWRAPFCPKVRGHLAVTGRGICDIVDHNETQGRGTWQGCCLPPHSRPLCRSLARPRRTNRRDPSPLSCRSRPAVPPIRWREF